MGERKKPITAFSSFLLPPLHHILSLPPLKKIHPSLSYLYKLITSPSHSNTRTSTYHHLPHLPSLSYSHKYVHTSPCLTHVGVRHLPSHFHSRKFRMCSSLSHLWGSRCVSVSVWLIVFCLCLTHMHTYIVKRTNFLY